MNIASSTDKSQLQPHTRPQAAALSLWTSSGWWSIVLSHGRTHRHGPSRLGGSLTEASSSKTQVLARTTSNWVLTSSSLPLAHWVLVARFGCLVSAVVEALTPPVSLGSTALALVKVSSAASNSFIHGKAGSLSCPLQSDVVLGVAVQDPRIAFF